MDRRKQRRGWGTLLPLALLTLCSAAYATDSYEPDNSAEAARSILTTGAAQTHEIDPAPDVDFVRFAARAGDQCVIETSAPPVGKVRDTVLTLIGPDGSSVLAEDDDSGENLFSRIEHTFATPGTHYVKVRSYNASYTGGYLVAVTLSRPATIEGTVTRGGRGAAGVAVWARPLADGLDRPACTAITRVDGSYVLSVEAGSYAVSAHLTGEVASPAKHVVTAPRSAADFALTTAPPVPADGVQTCRAVLVGIADYAGTTNDLTYCDDDALAFAEALTARANWRAQNVTLLLNRQASRDAIWCALQRMATLSDGDDLCLFFFSGHGTRGPDLAPLDEAGGQDEYLVETDLDANIRDDELGEWVATLPTTKFVGIIASCYSGGMIKAASVNAKGLGAPEPAGSADGFGEDLRRAMARRASEVSPLDLDDNGFGVVITAADDDETCWESEDLQHDVFVYYVLEGMAGDADTNHDRRVSAEEVFAYAAPHATAYNSGQHAQIYDARRSSPLNFLDLTPASTGGDTPPLTHHFGVGVQMISLPGSVAGARLGQSAGASTATGWDAIAQEYTDSDAAAEAGVGCWARFSTAHDASVACEQYAGDSFTWELQRGWNIVGVPWNQRVPLSAMEFAPTGSVAPMAWTCRGDGYEVVSGQNMPGIEASDLLPWRAYWLYADERCTATISRTTASAMAQQLPGWAIRLIARTDSGSGATAICGVSEREMAVPETPRAEGMPDMCLQGASGMLAADLRPEGAREYEWQLRVSAPPGQEVTVLSPDLSAVPRGFRVVLEDRETGVATLLRTAPGYRFTAGAAPRRLILRVERSDALIAIASVIAQQTLAGATVSFTLSAPADVSAQVLNIAGRPVRTIVHQRAQAAGVHSLAWDLRSSSGSAVPGGRYLVRLTARGDDGEVASALAPLGVSR